MTKTVKSILQDLEEEKKEVNMEYFLRLVAVLSLYRPGPMDEIPNYIKGMKNPEKVIYDPIELKKYLEETKGIIVYQEQIMQTVRELAGFTRGQSDHVRKAMGKKILADMKLYGDAFVYGSEEKNIKGCISNGIPETVAVGIWQKMVKFADYAFNKSHAVGYGVVAAQTAWLATHYKTEYYTATLNFFIYKQEKVQKYLAVARDLGMDILTPDFNKSDELFTVDGKNIRFGLKGIRGVCSSASMIINERNNNGPFKNMKDFVIRMKMQEELRSNVLKNLILAGALDTFEGIRKEKAEASDMFLELASFMNNMKKKGIGTILSLPGVLGHHLLSPELPGKVEMN